jgi:hypothetical protein
VRRKEWQQIVHDLTFPQGTIAVSPSKLSHEIHWAARFCRAIWTMLALAWLLIEMMFFYLARLLTGRRDMRTDWF